MRGKEGDPSPENVRPRITPACAGKRSCRQRLSFVPVDHPRVCGEKGPTVPLVGIAMGSPPRVRGKVRDPKTGRNVVGITPACAGKRGWPRRGWPREGDHPRVCGEKITSATISSPVRGSPPRVRGKVTGHYSIEDQTRITPACAGKRSALMTCLIMDEDHPRVCGEKSNES